ncbi:MAG: hypothetical protein RLZZ271_619 [Pseudomonadota bacterium]|jgi:hypothetical protein
MSNIYTPTQINQFKRDAKRIVREQMLSHAEALDQIAVNHGHSNWSLLMKHAALIPVSTTRPAQKPDPYLLVRTTEEMREAMLKTVPRQGQGSEGDRLRAQIKDLSTQFVSAKNALDYAIAYMECALGVPRFKVHYQSFAYYEMRCWLPYCVHTIAGNTYILLGRDYKPVGMVQKKNHVDYAPFSQVHLHMTEQQLRQQVTVYRRDGAEGYLYDVSPWTSRKEAQSYLNHLKKFRHWLSSMESGAKTI